MIGVQKWTTTKGAPSLVFFCNFLLNDQSGRPASGRESRINSYFPRGGPCFLVKPSFSSFVLDFRASRIRYRDTGREFGANRLSAQGPGSDGLGL
jgi:hypothetical protein